MRFKAGSVNCRLTICHFQSLLIVVCLAFVVLPQVAFADIQKAGDDDAKRLIKQADRAVKRGQLDEAEKLLRRASEIDPKASLPKLKLAFVYIKLRRLGDAYELAFPVAKQEPKNSYAFAVLGATMLNAGRFREARVLFITSIKIDRSESLAWAGLGMIDFYENDINESLSNMNEAVYYDPLEPDYLYAQAQVAARAEKYKEAADAYDAFLRATRNVDDERRARIKGLIDFLHYLGGKTSLYQTGGADSTKVNFELVGNRPIIKLRINGRPTEYRFVLDTGSGISVISEDTALALGMKAVAKGGFAKGIGGDGRFKIIYGFVREMNLGDVVVRSVPVYIRKFHSDGIDGYIGLSLISKFLTTVDYGDKTFALERRRDDAERADVQGSVSLPLRLTSSGFLSGEVQVEGIESPLNFIVDTGASVSVISDEIAAHNALASHLRSEKMTVIGSAGVTEDVPSFMLPKLSFGKHSRSRVTAIALDLDMINEASGFEQAGILGGNFLRNYRMTFDFKNSKVTFVSINQEPEK